MARFTPIPNNEDYLVSDHGDIVNTTTGKKLKPVKNSNGYYKVMLHGKQYDIHRLVAQAYVPNPDNLPQVNHKDEDKASNVWTNLEWVTDSTNMKHGTRGKRAVENGSGIAKTIYQYKDGELVGVWSSQKLVSKVFNLKQTSISRCLNGVYKTAGGYTWSYTLIPE